MTRLDEKIKMLSERLDIYHLPANRLEAIEIARELDLLKDARRIILYYEKEEELNQQP